MRSLWSFPNPVNDRAARTVAAGVVLMALAYAVTGWLPILVALAYGFVARTLTGPTLSPLGQLATRVVVPRLGLEPVLVPGPPKRFAQGIGAVVSVSALGLAVAADAPTIARIVAGALVIPATLEAAFGFCIGCKIFALLMKVGIIPPQVCEACNDLSLRRA